MENPYQTHETNVTGTLNLLREAFDGGIEKFVFASSTAVYGITKLPIKYIPTRKGDIKHNYGNPTKAEKELGFKAKNSLSSGLKKMVEALPN